MKPSVLAIGPQPVVPQTSRVEQGRDLLVPVENPAGAGFHGCKQSGYGRETDQQTLRSHQEVKNVLVSHDPKPLGFFA